VRTQKVDPQVVQELLDESGAKYSRNANSFILHCPKCSKEKLYVYRDNGYFTCFVCAETENFKGSLPYLLRELGLDYNYAKTKLYGGVAVAKEGGGLELDIRFPWADNSDDNDVIVKEEERVPVTFPPEFIPLDHPEAKVGALYLLKRGVPPEALFEYGIMYDPQRKTVVFPLFENGKLYGWQSRRTDNGKIRDAQTGNEITLPKAITTAARGVVANTVMFHDRLIGSDHAIICEGPMDAIKCHLAGGNVATLGKAVKDGQLEAIRRTGIRKIYLALDPDAGVEAQKIAKKLWDLELYLLHPLPGYKDLGDMTVEQVYGQFLRAPRIDGTTILLKLEF